MFEIKPLSLKYTFVCPDCNCKFGQPSELIFMGTNLVADCICECCENRYFHTVPTGHAVLFPVAFSQKTEKARYDEKLATWFARPLIDAVRKNRTVERPVSVKKLRSFREVILLNCLDSCYGHVFLKLLNAQQYLRKYPARGLVILLPENFEWLVPEGVAEVWIVKAKLSDFNNRISNLDFRVKEELERFDIVWVSEVPIHPDIHEIGWKEFLKTEKFNLNDFETGPARITFILREDRFWLNNRLDDLLLKWSISKGWLRTFRRYFVAKQNKHIRKLAAEIHKRSERKVEMYAAGLGQTGQLGPLIQDRRKKTIDETIEKEWCDLYADSHLVIGIHGSNMLIPTALSAGFIELLPRHKIYNLTEDIAMAHRGRYMQFLGRYLDEFSSVSLVAEHAVSLINWFPFLKKNTEAEV